MKTLLAVVFASAMLACSSGGPYVWASQVPAPPPVKTLPIEAGDRLQFVVFGQDTMSGEAEVRPAGDVIVPVVGKVPAAGLTTEALAQEVTRRLQGMLADPKVTVIVVSRRLVTIGVVGEVKTPGRYEVKQGEGVLDALARAGGLTVYANTDRVFVVKRASTRIRFRYDDLTSGDAANLRFRLEDGDVVVVE